MNSVPEESLLEYLAARVGCDYISDLRYLQPEQRSCLAAVLADISNDAFTLPQWNEVLRYLTYMPPQETVAQARRQLVFILTCPAGTE